MINFFRKIRKKLANENKFQKYTRYAIGEVALIMIGIFMALQLNNWNENRKQEAQFKATLEQLYNSISDDSWYIDFVMKQSQMIIDTTDYLLNFNDSTSLENLPMTMWYTTFHKKNSFTPRSLQILDNLNYNTNDLNQAKLANQLLDFKDLITVKNINYWRLTNKLDNLLLDHNIPFPKFDFNNISKGLISDSSYYSHSDYLNAYNLLNNDNFITNLKTQRTVRAFAVLDYRAVYEESEAMLRQIKKYYPDVKLLYEDVGIIGTAINGFNDVGASSTPMILADEEKSIWTIDLFLKEGSVKFRCRDSWAQNWGGQSFPKGVSIYDGPDIPITETGNYHIKLNLTENTYEFIKIKD